jgi:putative DNA primase/helicase
MTILDTATAGVTINEDNTAPEFSQEHLALQFAARYADKLRFVAKWNKWLFWDGKVWRFDDTRKTFSLARRLCREFAARVNRAREAKDMASAKTRAAVVSLASEDPRLAATVDQWDADPWLLNTPEGVVDLWTGELRAARPQDYMTKITAAGPSGDCPQWKAHLQKIFNNNQELVDYLQRFFGYCLTGDTREHSLHYCWGTGRNGKGTTINTFAALLGDYHKTAPTEMFIATKSDRHPTELAMLRGARLVTASETEKGQRWSESKIKSLTGDDPITARFMRQDFFDFMGQFKICISGNHKPGLRTVDEAIKARMHLIPFLLFIPKQDRDLQLKKKLQQEWPGILQWAIEGCLTWQRDGLQPPKVVTDATEEYLAGADVLASWFVEECVHDPQQGLFTIALYESFARFAKDRGELFIMPMREFSTELADRADEFKIRKANDLRRRRPEELGGEEEHGNGFLGVKWRYGQPRMRF